MSPDTSERDRLSEALVFWRNRASEATERLDAIKQTTTLDDGNLSITVELRDGALTIHATGIEDTKGLQVKRLFGCTDVLGVGRIDEVQEARSAH